MYLHVTTNRLGTSAEVDAELDAFHGERIEVVSDQTARTIASWYMTPSPRFGCLTRLAHGLPTDSILIAEELERAGMYPQHYSAMVAWLEHTEAVLSDKMGF